MRCPLLSFLLVLCTTPAFASSPEPSREDIARAAQTCTAEGAFGIRFGQKAPERVIETNVAPFRVMGMAEQDGYGVFEVVGNTSFAKAPMSQEDRIALTEWYIGKLDTEIDTTHKPAKRVHRAIVGKNAADRRNTVTYTFSEGFTLELVHAGVNVNLICTDTVRKKRP